MSPALILAVVLLYFVVLLGIAFYTSRGATNETFFIGQKKSNWLLVAYGMIGTSLSGVTFMSVPGEVNAKGFMYMQVVIGYFIGYMVVAFLLLPLYYRLNLTSIYSYLQSRFGNTSYKTGAGFFLLSRTLGASIRIYLVLIVLQHFLLDALGIPFAVSVFVILLMILLYTFNGGVKTIVWTDTLQTTGMILALIITIGLINTELNFSFSGLVDAISAKGYTSMFQTQDWKAGSFFLKQILGGAFVTITMTGLDQEMMQKNISVRNVGESQKNMLVFSVILVAVNLLFLVLGGALYLFLEAKGISIPAKTDETFSMVALNYLPPVAGLVFILGLVSALFPSADGALTALTSSICIDMLNMKDRSDWTEEKKLKTRRIVHISITVLFLLLILVYQQVITASVISTILKVAGYTYGPLLGLFAFGILTSRKTQENIVPFVCVLSPVICWVLAQNSVAWFNGYQFGFELLAVNGLITFLGLLVISKKAAVLS
ncbi:MAG TPA: sodium:solute symporter [Chitinophagales bacterium]|nr:sodium:solute symporter [Chitinophagales bacterium]